MRHRLITVVAVVVGSVASFTVPARAQARPAAPGLDVKRLALIAGLVNEAIEAKQTPGAVVVVGRGNRVYYQKAFGHRSLQPTVEAMTLDTVFDLASLTKVVATTTSIMMLVEDGRLRLSDRVAAYIPGFERYGKADITIRHLLTHVSGLRPDLDMSMEFASYDEAIARAIEEVPTASPGRRFAYSDINFFLLGEVVHRVSGQSLDQFARTRIFEPLGMRDTMFKPPAALAPRIAPTERCSQYGWPCDQPGGVILRGVVHDPTARRMLGVAGHAGLFSTAADLAIFCQTLINGGRFGATQVLSPLTVARMTSPIVLPGDQFRGLGWDMDSPYSSNRGELLPPGSYGHTGFTGTSLWIDPTSGTWVIFLSNRVHPDGKGDVTPLRGKVASVVGSAIVDRPGEAVRQPRLAGGDFGAAGTAPARPAWTGPVLNGIDVLKADGFAALKGRSIGLVTNHTGRTLGGESTIDLLARAPAVKLVALFSPEHGIRGAVDAEVSSSKDEKTGLPIYSLYGETLRPTPQMLEGIDTMVFDIQDVGVRFYTYETTMAYVMEEAAKRKIRMVVLDRVNPIEGFRIEGPALDKALASFVGYFPTMPVRHGMTMGELARLFNGENKIGADLTVIQVKGYHREQWFDETGQPWINPSPNMRTMNQATLYPGVCLIEGANVSVGRGTDTPFEQIGAPWIDGPKLASDLNARRLPGIRFYPTSFTPSTSKYKDERCQGVFMLVTDREAMRPVRVGIELLAAVRRLHGDRFEIDKTLRLVGSARVVERIKLGDDPAAIAQSWANEEGQWRLLRAKYLIYR
ncbi:MAG TPA: exo-beta-N-acetylmuramidase NamZ domain-containing protein [Vicinamibacterales bacterium]